MQLPVALSLRICRSGVLGLEFRGQVAENPFVNAAGFLIEVLAANHTDFFTVIVLYPAPQRRLKTRMRDGELEKPTRFDDAERFANGAIRIGHVHQAHEGCGEVERAIAEGKFRATADLIVDAERILLFSITGVTNKGW